MFQKLSENVLRKAASSSIRGPGIPVTRFNPRTRSALQLVLDFALTGPVCTRHPAKELVTGGSPSLSITTSQIQIPSLDHTAEKCARRVAKACSCAETAGQNVRSCPTPRVSASY
jgi:hypothetical protein